MIQNKFLIMAGCLGLLPVALGVAAFVGSSALAANGTYAEEEIPESVAADKAVANFLCTSVADVASWGGVTARIHVRCGIANGFVIYYAHASDPANSITADQMLAIANTALALGKNLRFYYQTDTNLNPPGCSPVDCRGLTGVQLFQ